MNLPGTTGKPFYLKFDSDYWKKGEILSTGRCQVRVIKVYRRTWWRRLFLWLGFRVRIFQVKVVQQS